MSVKYLLPCRCGRQIVIEPRQAGQTIACECGAVIEAPTMLDMTALEPAPVESVSVPTPTTWGPGRRLRLLGIMLLGGAIAGGVALLWWWPVSPSDAINPAHIRDYFKGLPPALTFDVWESMKQGLDRRTDQRYAAKLSQFQVGGAFAIAVALIGAALIAVGTARTRSDRGNRRT